LSKLRNFGRMAPHVDGRERGQTKRKDEKEHGTNNGRKRIGQLVFEINQCRRTHDADTVVLSVDVCYI